MRELFEQAEVSIPVLFVVHPGSACGSADFYMGGGEAALDRAKLADFVARWQGGLVVLSGEHDRELRANPYRTLGHAIDHAFERATRIGLARRERAPDPEQMRAAPRVAAELGLAPDQTIVVTGAWASRGESGCVNSVVEALRHAGFQSVTLSDSAVFE